MLGKQRPLVESFLRLIESQAKVIERDISKNLILSTPDFFFETVFPCLSNSRVPIFLRQHLSPPPPQRNVSTIHEDGRRG